MSNYFYYTNTLLRTGYSIFIMQHDNKEASSDYVSTLTPSCLNLSDEKKPGQSSMFALMANVQISPADFL